MIKTIIFDFGNVFINLNIEDAIQKALKSFEIESFSEEMVAFNSLYETGLVSTNEFLEFYSENFPELSNEDLIENWNFMLKDFPEYRLDFLKQLKASKKYKLILLSNTNELHINWIKKHVPFYNAFKSCFNTFYLSQEINLRKPNLDVFEFVLSENHLVATECLFIDDVKGNTDAANQLGIRTWNINPEKEDVVDLFKIKSDLF